MSCSREGGGGCVAKYSSAEKRVGGACMDNGVSEEMRWVSAQVLSVQVADPGTLERLRWCCGDGGGCYVALVVTMAGCFLGGSCHSAGKMADSHEARCGSTGRMLPALSDSI